MTNGFALNHDLSLQTDFCAKRQAKNDSERCQKHSTVNPSYINTQYNDKICYNDNSKVTKPLLKR